MDPRIQWLNRVQMPIQKAMQCGRYEEALHHINNALMSVSAVSAAPQVVCGLWSNRAECQWQMRQYQQCLEDLNQAHVLGAHPSPSQRKNAYEKWIARSEQLLDSNLPHADAYFEFCLRVLSSNHKEHARCCILWGVTKIIFSDRTQGTQLIVKGMNLDWNVLKEYLAHWKSAGIAAMRDHDYLRAKQLLQRALIASIDRSHIETRRSILSHLASVHFELKEYDKALEAGRQSFVDTGGTCVDEANRWKERGKKLFKEKNYLLLIEYYTLAIDFTPHGTNHNELRSMLLSNRSTAYCKLKRFDDAYADALMSVKIIPNWSKGHYRLGSSFVGLQRYREGCVAFCNAFNFADESDKLDVLLQILSAAVKLPAGLEGIHLSVPKAMVQDLIKRFVLNKDWVKLSLLFLGGGGANEYGRGGLATGCDASGVPLELIVDFDSTTVNLAKLVDVLIKDGAPFMGSPGCAESPLKIAVRKKNKELLDVLSKYDKSRATDWLQKGAQAFEEGNYGKAITLLSTAVKGELNFEQQMLAYHHLSDACYITEEYRDCIEYASKAHSKEPLQSKGMSETWKQRGNELLKLKLYDLMSDYYSLALRYAPPDCNELRAAVYSNRSMAYVNRNMIRDAKADARRCIELRKTWFRGYSRLAACWTAEDNHQEAIDEYCRGLRAVKVENEKSCLVADIVATSMKLADGAITIPVNIPTKLINVVVKQAVNDKDVEKLRHLLVEKRCQPPDSMDLRCLGHYADCAACVPLEMVMESNVQDKYILIEELLSRGSSPNGHPNCNKEPIVLAMNECNYKIAAMLLRHGANPQFILINRQEPFDPWAPHFSQWLSLGRKALKSREFVRAKQFYSLALEYPEAAKDKSAKCEALRALSDISFELRWYDDCILKGRDCFKVSPIKSEIEAVKWQQRGQVLAINEMHDEVPSYLTLAMNYAPPSNEKLRFELLCLRSNAYRAINDYSQAIEDGKSATAIKPEQVEGHMCLVSCYKNLQRPSKTFSALIQCLKAVGHSIVHKQYLREALDIAVNLPEGTTTLTTEVSKASIQQIHEEAVQSENWELLRLLYLGGGGPEKHEIRKGGLATNRISAERVPIEDVVSANFSSKPETLEALLNHGAKVDGLRGNATPLVSSTSKKNEEVIRVLLDHGANPCVKTDNNQPLIHNVVLTAIDTGDVQILEILLNSGHSDIENVQDSNGNSLYNRAMSGKINNNKCKVVKRLINAKINPDIPNKQGKRPKDCCNKRDDRNRMLQKFIKEYTPKPVEENKQHSRTENNKDSQLLLSIKERQEEITEERVSETSEEQDMDVEEPQSSPINVKQSKSKVDITKRKIEEERKYLQCLIENLIIEEPDVSTQQKLSEEAIPDELIELLEEDAENEEQENVSETCREEGETPPQTENNEEAGDEADETTSHFENLTWEVDCTENVWKTMRSKKVTEKTKKQVIEKIRMLAEGRWSSKKLCKRLEGEPKERGILLYESRLTRSARIIWEKTIAFSPRCSNDPELRLSASDHGLIYSDIIRVWDIVLDHGDLDHRIQNVVKSHDRGSHCIIKSNLKGMKKHKQDSNNQLSLPSYYQERKKSSDEQPAMEYNDVFFPPASSEENEYHILKFYSFTSALIDTLLDGDQKTKIDFPFKVTELEHAIINLKPDKACTIILLGRSGTGKTTCCLYRLWTEFQNYWEKAVTAGPHLPKYVPAETTGDEEERSVSETRSDVPSQAMAAVPSHQSSETERNLYFSEPSSEYVDPDEKATEAMEIQEAEDNSPGYYEHLHQMFITKNTVLCSEVQKNFKELRNACPDTKAMTVSEDSLPNHIKDIGEEAWPLFVGARDWLLLLDASLPGIPFFQRTADGSLLRKIEGWGQEDMHLHFIPDDDDEEDELEEEGEHAHAVAEKEDQQNPKSSKVRSNKREVTYQVFMNELWPKMKKSVKNDYHPTLVWTEIRSFIKGSAEALKTSTGYLSCDEYKELGRKRAPNFMGDRSTVYQLFTSYQNIIRSSKRMFDEADLVYNLHNRLMENRELEWSIHNIYVDETQDFTQAELSLLIHCCRFPNRMFFTGDTAQSIMRGIAFRFEDLKTLFHAIKTSDLLTSKEPVRVPDRLYQLTHNYRSHAGILRLASSIVNLLLHYFPESFDKLNKDCGLFEGPKPVLLESCSLTDLAMILRGNKRHASRIEFGAHQAVLVVSEEARDNMPEELKHGLVLTIYEAKGLEFDDVLIYNFFKDSHARKEWRVVASYIGKCQAEGHSGVTGLVEIREEDLNLKTRPLEFNHEKHKVLNSELKFLYTAITRARVNVWFFDEDEENRGPMFEYFRSLDLVRAITLDDQDERSTTTLTSMFAEGSDKSEWRDQGRFFYNKGLWDVAEKCYTFGEYEIMVRKCKAQKQAQEAFKCRSNPKQMKEKFCIAATQFLECSMPDEAVVCLHNAREKLLLAMLYKKMERFAEASKIFRSERCCEEASQCMEQMNNYNQAIEIFCEAKLYENAIQVLERYNSLKVDRSLANQGIIPPKPNRTIERLCYKLAETYLNEDQKQEMEAVLQRLPSIDRISFLKKNGCIEEAARALVDDDSKEDAARFLQLHGRFKEAMKYSKDHKFLADCNLYEARSLPNSGNQETIEALLKDAIKYYSRCGDKNGEAEALLLVGRQRNDIHNITESGKIFHINSNVCGEVEVVEDWLEHDVDQFYYRIIVRAMERVLELIINLHKPYTQLKTDKQKTIAVCEQFFGLSRVQDQNVRRYRTKTLERFQQLPHRDISYQGSSNLEERDVNTREAYDVIASHLMGKAVNLVHKITQFFKSKLEVNSDQVSPTGMAFNERFEVLFNWVYLDGITDKFQNELKRFTDSKILPRTRERMLTQECKEYRSCKLLVQFMFPDAGPNTQQMSLEQIGKVQTHHAVKPILMSFCDYLCKELEMKALSIDTLLHISHLRQILNMQDWMVRFLREKEVSFRNLTLSKTHEDRMKLMHENGMFPTGDQSGFEIFFRYWERGKKILHVYADVVQSLHETSRRFLGYVAKSHSLDYPSIASTVMILEHQLTIALVMATRLKTRHQGFSSCLPESYLSRLKFTDEMNCTRRNHYWAVRAVDEYARSLSTFQEEQKCLRQIQSLLSHIVNLMFGKFCKRFNVFLDTFSSRETETLVLSGVAERVLVLALTMLVNCGNILPVDCQGIILHDMFLVVPPMSLPGHLKEAFQKLNDASSFGDLVGILKTLLGARNGEKLFDVRFNESSINLNRKVAQPLNYSLMLSVDVSKIRAGISHDHSTDSYRPVQSERETKEEELEAQDDFESDQHLISSDDHEREKEEQEQRDLITAAIKCQYWLRKLQKRKREKEAIKDENELLPSVDRLSSEFKVDSSACAICGVNFTETSEGQPKRYEDHVLKELHRINVLEFEEYKEFYITSVEKVLEQAKSLNDKDTKELDLDVDMQRLNEMRQKVWRIVQDIEKDKKWKDIKGLKPLVKKIQKKIQEIKEMTEQVQASSLQEANGVDSTGIYNDIYDDEVGDLLPKPMPGSSGNQRKGKSHKARQRKHHK